MAYTQYKDYIWTTSAAGELSYYCLGQKLLKVVIIDK